MQPWQYTALTHKFNQVENKLLPKKQQLPQVEPMEETQNAR